MSNGLGRSSAALGRFVRGVPTDFARSEVSIHGERVGPPLVLAPQPVDILRADDLLLLRCSFQNLRWGDAEPGQPPVLVRNAENQPAFLIVRFPPQHIVERAFFQTADGITVKNPTTTQGSAGVQDPDIGKPDQPIEAPPIFASLAGHSWLAFRVADERITYSVEGILEAMSVLDLAVAPNALPPQHTIVFPWRDLIAGGIDASLLMAATGTSGVSRSRAGPALGGDAFADALGFARLSRTALSLERRFGSETALRTLAAARLGDRIGAGKFIDVGIKRRPKPALPSPPGDTVTAIELPWRLVVSPNASGAWAHDPTAIERNGRFELWHTRMGTRDHASDGSPIVLETPQPDRTIRAIWARDFTEIGPAFTSPPETDDFPSATGDDDRPKVRTSLNSRDRMMLVHETSNFQLTRQGADWNPQAVPVDRLMLSTMGGWLESRVLIPSLPDGPLTIEEWKHLATMARDHEVKVVYAGFLLPFGHKASLVKVTERKIYAGTSGPVAYLFQRMFIIVREPEKQYASTATLPNGMRADLAMPLKTVRILTRVTPDLDPPVTMAGDAGPGSGLLFIPYVGKAPFPFKILAVDREGNSVEYRGPLGFMERDRAESAAALTNALDTYNKQSSTDRRMPLNGQRLAYADSQLPDDTVLATDGLTFDATTALNAFSMSQDQARFAPVINQVDAVVPAMSALAGAATVVNLDFPTEYLERGFANNTAQVFLKLKNAPAALEFAGQSDRSGGFVTPSLAVTGLSRLTGPIGGDVAAAIGTLTSAGQFDPKQFFAGVKAKLFGVVALTDILDAVGFDPSKVPSFVAQTLDVASTLVENARRLAQAVQTVEATVGASATQLKAALLTFQGDFAALTAKPTEPPPNLVNDLTAVADKLGPFSTAVATAEALQRAEREQLAGLTKRLQEQLADATAVAQLLQQLANGDLLPEVVTARLDWSTDIQRWALDGTKGAAVAPDKAILSPVDDSGNPITAAKLALAVEVQAPTTGDQEPTALVTCSISAIDLQLIAPVTFLTLHFKKFEFSVVPGKKPDVNVLFDPATGIEFAGPLAFVNNLRDIIPFDGFSDPPYLDVTASGIEAGFDLSLPNLSVGIFSLENISLGAHVNVPFLDESLEVGFNFCTRENPFRLSVMLFAGGGFVGITVTPDGVRVLEAALEFGAAVSINFGVASGGLSAMAGIYFKIEMVSGDDQCTLTGYFRLRGEVDVLGLISASIELYLALTYESATNSASGRATLTIEVEVLFFSTSVSISCEKKFAGAGSDPTFVQQMGLRSGALPGEDRPWDTYARAFADD